MNAAQHTSRFAPTIRTTPRLNRERSVPSALSTFTTARWGQVSVCLPSYRTDRKRMVSFLKPGAPPLSNRFFSPLFTELVVKSKGECPGSGGVRLSWTKDHLTSHHAASPWSREYNAWAILCNDGLVILFSFRFSECENKKKWQEEKSRVFHDWSSVR